MDEHDPESCCTIFTFWRSKTSEPATTDRSRRFANETGNETAPPLQQTGTTAFPHPDSDAGFTSNSHSSWRLWQTFWREDLHSHLSCESKP